MIDKDPVDYPWLTYLFVIAFSCWGGIVTLIQRYRLYKERRFSIIEVIGELAISAFAGMLVYYFCTWLGLEGNLRSGLVGVAGHMGSRVIFMIEQAVKAKFKGVAGISGESDGSAGHN